MRIVHNFTKGLPPKRTRKGKKLTLVFDFNSDPSVVIRVWRSFLYNPGGFGRLAGVGWPGWWALECGCLSAITGGVSVGVEGLI